MPATTFWTSKRTARIRISATGSVQLAAAPGVTRQRPAARRKATTLGQEKPALARGEHLGAAADSLGVREGTSFTSRRIVARSWPKRPSGIPLDIGDLDREDPNVPPISRRCVLRRLASLASAALQAGGRLFESGTAH